MSRPLRIEFAGALYHVMSHGNERADIVRDDHDRQKRLDWLRRTVCTYGWRLHSFVLMTNHGERDTHTPLYWKYTAGLWLSPNAPQCRPNAVRVCEKSGRAQRQQGTQMSALLSM
jgi:hypothetical protein